MCLLRGTYWVFIYNSTFCPHSVFMCFVWIWEQTAIISVYSINLLVFINETECLLRGTDWVFIYNSTFCPHSVFMCFVLIWEQTAIISLYNINWLVFITETECVYCAVRTGSLYNWGHSLSLSLPHLKWHLGRPTVALLSRRWSSSSNVVKPTKHSNFYAFEVFLASCIYMLFRGSHYTHIHTGFES